MVRNGAKPAIAWRHSSAAFVPNHARHEQLAWLESDLASVSHSTPLVVLAHIPLWTIWEPWGWGTADSDQAIALLRILDAECRAPSALERDILNRYTGWGGLKELFEPNPLPEWRERSWQGESAPGTQFFDALHILGLLWIGHRRGEVLTLRQLHAAVKLRIDQIEWMLDTMSAAQWIGRTGPGWALIRDPREISIADVYRLFVFRGGPRITAGDGSPSAWVVPTNEELTIARHTVACLGGRR